jgi:hypothetical protein
MRVFHHHLNFDSVIGLFESIRCNHGSMSTETRSLTWQKSPRTLKTDVEQAKAENVL